MENRSKGYRDKYAYHSAESSTNQCHQEDIERGEIEGPTHHHRYHDISLDPLEKDIESGNRDEGSETCFRIDE
jgi:hypothetical protein